MAGAAPACLTRIVAVGTPEQRDDPWPARRPGSPGDRPVRECPAPGTWTRSAGVLPAGCCRPAAHHHTTRRRRRPPSWADRLLGGQRWRYLPGPGRARSRVRVLDLRPTEILIRTDGAKAAVRCSPHEPPGRGRPRLWACLNRSDVGVHRVHGTGRPVNAASRGEGAGKGAARVSVGRRTPRRGCPIGHIHRASLVRRRSTIGRRPGWVLTARALPRTVVAHARDAASPKR